MNLQLMVNLNVFHFFALSFNPYAVLNIVETILPSNKTISKKLDSETPEKRRLSSILHHNKLTNNKMQMKDLIRFEPLGEQFRRNYA